MTEKEIYAMLEKGARGLVRAVRNSRISAIDMAFMEGYMETVTALGLIDKKKKERKAND